MGLNTKSMGILLMALIPIMTGGIWWWTGPRVDAREKRREMMAMSVGKQIGLAAVLFTEDHHGQLPNAAHWEQDLQAYYPNLSQDIVIEGPAGAPIRRFAMNSALSEKPLGSLQSPSETVLFFESVKQTPNAADRFISAPHDQWRRAVMFGDGHGYSLSPQTVDTMRQLAGDGRFLDGK